MNCPVKELNRNGFSFPELIIALSLLSFVLLAAYSLITGGLSDISETRDYSVAVLLSQEIIEACRGFKYDLLDEDDPFLDESGNPTGAKNGMESLEWDCNNDGGTKDNFSHVTDMGGILFTRDVTIEQVKREIPSGLPAELKPSDLKLKSVNVKVKWKNKSGRDVEYEVSTLVSSIYK